MIRSLSLYSAGESNSDCKIENLEYYCKNMAIILHLQILLQKDEKYCKNQEEKGYKMIPLKSLVFEKQGYDY